MGKKIKCIFFITNILTPIIIEHKISISKIMNRSVFFIKNSLYTVVYLTLTIVGIISLFILDFVIIGGKYEQFL